MCYHASVCDLFLRLVYKFLTFLYNFNDKNYSIFHINHRDDKNEFKVFKPINLNMEIQKSYDLDHIL